MCRLIIKTLIDLKGSPNGYPQEIKAAINGCFSRTDLIILIENDPELSEYYDFSNEYEVLNFDQIEG